MDNFDYVLESLAHLVCGDKDKELLLPIDNLSAAHFDGFDLIREEDWFGEDLTDVDEGDQRVWPLDVSFGFPNPKKPDSLNGVVSEEKANDGSLFDADNWTFYRGRTLVPKEWRGKVHRIFPKMLDLSLMVTASDGRSSRLRRPFAITGGKLLPVPAMGVTMAYAADDPSWGQTVLITKMLSLVALRRQQSWSVLIGEGKGPRVRFLTDAAGMREVFRLRDAPPGKRRRSALLNWVREHWRKNRDTSEADRIWINAHMRGAQTYTWNGLRCEIQPSLEDTTKAAILRKS